MRVLETRGVEFESNLPFAGLSELLRPVLRQIDALPDSQAAALRGALALGPPASGDRFAVYAATLSLLAAAAEDEPVLVVVDDAHWLDLPSAEAVLFATRRLEAEGVGVLLAARDDEAFVAPGIEELSLRGLDGANAAALVAASAPRTPATDVVETLVRGTAGNPLALIEAATGLSERQLAGEEPMPEPLPTGAAAARAFGRRIDALGDETRRALLVAATAATNELGPILRALETLGVPAGALEQAESADLVTTTQGDIAFAHPLVRAAASVAASPAEQRAVHRALADALAEERFADRRVLHLAAAAFGPDEDVARALEETAASARARSGYAPAAAALERAARLTPDPATRPRRLVAAADAARLAGRGDDAVRLLADALAETDDPLLRARIQHARGRIELFDGRARSAYELLAAEAARIEALDGDRAATMRAEAAVAAYYAGDAGAAVATAVEARSAMRTAGGLADLVTTLILGTALCRTGQTSEGVALLMRGAAIAEEEGEHRPELEYVLFAALVLVWVGEHERARTLLRRVVDEARAASALGILPLALHVSATLETRDGRWPAAYADASEGARIATETGSALWRCACLSALSLLEAARGREDACRAHAAEAVELAGSLELERAREAGEALGLLELGLGRAEEALAHLEPALRVGGARDDWPPLVLRPSSPDLLEAYLRAGRPVPAAVTDALAEGEAIEVPSFRATVVQCRALLASDDELDERFGAALDAHERAQLPFWHARTRLAYGERLRRAGRRVDSRTELRVALQTLDRLGATPWAERAAAELRATGETLHRRDPTAAEKLTAQELQIAMVVARGATNREAGAALFLSPKTIEVHLTRVYRKLGVRSRTELAGLFASDDAALEAARPA
jgi:DNA-binding CsgD family transcriptional regulator